MSDYRPTLHESLALAFDRHAELLAAAARDRLLREGEPRTRPFAGWLHALRQFTGDRLIDWGMRLKTGTAPS